MGREYFAMFRANADGAEQGASSMLAADCEMDLVSVDIGGTHARFVIATVDDDGTITLDDPETIHTEDHASFQTAWEDFRSAWADRCHRACRWRLPGRSAAM